MPEPPYDRPLVLASLVQTMRDHYLAIVCACGARRVIAVGQMVKDRRVAGLTMAHVALSLACDGCYDGPDQVHLTATIFGVGPAPSGGGGLCWTLPLVERSAAGARRRKVAG